MLDAETFDRTDPRCKKCLYMSVVVCRSPPMSGEFATSEWRVVVLSVGFVSIFVVSAVLQAIHSLFDLPYDISHQFPRLKPQNIP